MNVFKWGWQSWQLKSPIVKDLATAWTYMELCINNFYFLCLQDVHQVTDVGRLGGRGWGHIIQVQWRCSGRPGDARWRRSEMCYNADVVPPCLRWTCGRCNTRHGVLTLKVLVTTIDAQWEGMGDVGSARYEPTLLPPCPTIKVLSYSN